MAEPARLLSDEELEAYRRERDIAPDAYDVAPTEQEDEDEESGSPIPRTTPTAAPWLPQIDRPTIEEARIVLRTALRDYLMQENPHEMLLVQASPGTGKTWAAVLAAEAMAAQGRRVLYAGPRHAFFQDVLAMTEYPAWWYEWLPRQEESEGHPETCRHTATINTWMARGYRAIDFCSQVCGWDYVNKQCPYHAQKRRPEPIIFGMHQHVVLGHPLTFHAVIGDEYPVPVFCHPWRIPAEWVVPPVSGYSILAPAMRCILAALHDATQAGYVIDGPALLALLGGPEAVAAACEAYEQPQGGSVLPPKLEKATDVEKAPYAHTPLLARLLAREAEAARRGGTYPARVLVAKDHLTLLTRYGVAEGMPQHIVWLDATANARLYAAVFDRDARLIDAQPRLQGRVFQVTDRANGRSSLFTEDGGLTPKVAQTRTLIDHLIATHGYTHPGVISFQGLEAALGGDEALTTHFYAARGTNMLQDVDALFIVGTPQPPRTGITYMARMVYPDRMAPFDTRWQVRDVTYPYVDPVTGMGWQRPVGGYWQDDDLQAVLWSLREAEIVQAAHRCRPINHPVDIWLLTNVPLDALPPTRLLEIEDVYDTPEGVDANKYPWAAVVLPAAIRANADHGAVTLGDFLALGMHRHTATSYLAKIIAGGWYALDQDRRRALRAAYPHYWGGRRGRGAAGAWLPPMGDGD